jgi:hypothetical protein
MTGQSRRIEILRPVAGRAAHADGAEAVDAAYDERQMRMPIIALRGTIARWVAIHAAGASDDLSRLGKKRN